MFHVKATIYIFNVCRLGLSFLQRYSRLDVLATPFRQNWISFCSVSNPFYPSMLPPWTLQSVQVDSSESIVKREPLTQTNSQKIIESKTECRSLLGYWQGKNLGSFFSAISLVVFHLKIVLLKRCFKKSLWWSLWKRRWGGWLNVLFDMAIVTARTWAVSSHT